MSELPLQKYNFISVNLKNPWDIEYFELHNSPVVDGTPDFTRLNTYISKDGNFINIWNGLLESMSAECALDKKGVEIPEGFDFECQYTEPLFRGYIDTDQELETILNTIRFDRFTPQYLSGDKNNRLSCFTIDTQ